MKISMVKNRLISLLLLITSGTVIHALPPQPRVDQMCGYMPTEAKIYCYGGHRFGANATVTSSFEQYFFSINLTQDWRVTDMPNGWEQITQDIGPNVNFAMEMVPNENIIFMHGGGISTEIQTRYKAAYFNTTDSVVGWKQVIPEQTGSRVIFQSAILGPDNSTIYIWGGMRDESTGDMEPGDEKYPLAMYTLDVKNWQWGTGDSAPAGYTYAKPVLVGSFIYYIGGYTTASNAIRSNPMDSILMYNTESGGWQTRSIGGSVIPSTRTRHTVTLKPSTGEVILFGGQNPDKDGESRDDYFYILNTHGDNLTWSTRALGGNFNALGIIGHSAVLVGDYLIILFGALNTDKQTSFFKLTNEVQALDVNRWSWVSSINALTPETQSPVTDADGPSSVNKGMIAGVVVGGAAGVAIIAGIIVFILRRKRKNRNLETEQKSSSSIRMLPDENEFSQVDIATLYAASKGPSDSPVVHGPTPTFYGKEKPDGSVSNSRSQVKEYQPLSFMKSVKPDGG